MRLCTVQRRNARGVDMVRALTLSSLGYDPEQVTLLTRREDWFAALADIFGLTLDDVSHADRDLLWRKVVAQHEACMAKKG